MLIIISLSLFPYCRSSIRALKWSPMWTCRQPSSWLPWAFLSTGSRPSGSWRNIMFRIGDYLQLSVSIFLLYLSIFVNRSILYRLSIDTCFWFWASILFIRRWIKKGFYFLWITVWYSRSLWGQNECSDSPMDFSIMPRPTPSGTEIIKNFHHYLGFFKVQMQLREVEGIDLLTLLHMSSNSPYAQNDESTQMLMKQTGFFQKVDFDQI